MSVSSSSNLYSHPDKALEQHLINVANIAEQELRVSPWNFTKPFDKNRLLKLIRICSLCHDLGKATAFFQDYLFASDKEKEELKSREETHHGLLSAVAAYFASKTEFEQDQNINGDEKSFLAFIAFLTVKKHHGNFDNAIDETRLSDINKKVLMKQIESIEKNKLSILNVKLKEAGLIQEINKELMKNWVSAIDKELLLIKMRLRKLERQKSLDPYLVTNFLFSLLIDADKTEVTIGTTLTRKTISLEPKIVDDYKAQMGIKDSFLNTLRQQAYLEVMKRPIDIKNKIISLNLPTGLGKTLTSLAFAFKLRKTLEKKGHTPRIIYSLPFLSIIEQNADHFEKVLTAAGFRVDTDLLLKHHHLAELSYKKDEDEFEPDQAKILVEGWNSEIVITTFYQLFHTLISHRNKYLRKFHRIAGSIIILDEIQSLPFKYWLLVKEVFNKLAQELDCYIIFVTATEPLIYQRDEVYPLVNRETYFKAINRVVVKPRLDQDQTIEEFAQSLHLDPNKTYLFILNTIKSAKCLFELLKDRFKDQEIAYLSTHVVPYERLHRIEKMRKGDVKLAVATQLVEAGVDIDFDVVYRDLAPLDSINQAAGRCNRNWRGEGEVIVISLKDDKRLYSSYIYDSVLLDITRRILSQNNTIHEKDFLDIIESYYREVQEKKSSEDSRQLLYAVYKMKYDSTDESTCIADFQLIDNDFPKIEVYIEINDEASEIWERYIKIKEIKDIFQRRLEFNKIKADFYKYTIAVPVNVDNLPPEVAGFRYVNRYSLKDFYDADTGFICQGVTPIW
mgnify:CR=1 FL=1